MTFEDKCDDNSSINDDSKGKVNDMDNVCYMGSVCQTEQALVSLSFAL